MRALKSHFVVIAQGDVAGVAVIHFRTDSRLVIHDRDADAPVIQVLLSDTERHLLIQALHDCLPSEYRRAFRVPRSSRRPRQEKS